MGGVMEYLLPDQTRVDCLTDKYAVEVDFAYRFYGAIGQALYYGYMTGKKPGIAVIVEKESDKRFLKRLKLVTDKEGIRVWVLKP